MASRKIALFIFFFSYQLQETQPQSLREQCLLKVRSCLAPHLQSAVRKLPVPNSIKRALALDDLSFIVSNGNGGHMLVYMDPNEAEDNENFLNELIFQKFEGGPL